MPLKQRIARICILLGCGFILIAALLLVQNEWAERYASQTSHTALLALTTKNDDNKGETSPSVADESEQTGLTAQTLTVDDNVYCGVLSLPTLGLELPIQADFSYPNLKSSPCVYQTDSNPAFVIGAHNYTAHFGNLPKLQLGDSIVYTPVGASACNYTVAEICTIEETDLQAIEGDANELVLFTCNINNNNQRIVVHCIQVEDA